jgi:hypothetical protein
MIISIKLTTATMPASEQPIMSRATEALGTQVAGYFKHTKMKEARHERSSSVQYVYAVLVCSHVNSSCLKCGASTWNLRRATYIHMEPLKGNIHSHGIFEGQRVQ